MSPCAGASTGRARLRNGEATRDAEVAAAGEPFGGPPVFVGVGWCGCTRSAWMTRCTARGVAMAVGTQGVVPVGGGRAITVLVADDEPLMRSALRMCLCTEPDIEVVGEARDGLEAVAMAERLRPDVVIMDIRMPNLDGVAATRWLTTAGADRPVRVLIITTFDLDEYIVEGLRAGASGFLLKDATPDELVARGPGGRRG